MQCPKQYRPGNPSGSKREFINQKLKTMETQVNTVNISLDEYHELKRIKEGIEEGKSMVVTTDNSYWPHSPAWFGSHPKIVLYTESEMVEECKKMNDALRDRLKDTKEYHDEIEKYLLPTDGPTYLQLKRMSIWEFVKWRKS